MVKEAGSKSGWRYSGSADVDVIVDKRVVLW